MFSELTLLMALGCGGAAPEAAVTEKPAAPRGAPAGPAAPTGGAAETPVAKEDAPATVEVSSEGSNFDPPVDVAAIPESAWYCDMGTVHYARMEQGDGRCGRCGMHLKQKAAVH